MLGHTAYGGNDSYAVRMTPQRLAASDGLLGARDHSPRSLGPHGGLARPHAIDSRHLPPTDGLTMLRVPDNEANRLAAADALHQGRVVAYPTDTLYGIGANAFDELAVAAVFAIKARPRSQGLPLLIADLGDLDRVATGVPPAALALAERFWPGMLTIVLRRDPALPAAVTGGGDTVGVRLPDHPSPRALIESLGAPITGTSANRHEGADPTTAEEVERQLGDLAMILDGGPCKVSVASTVVDLTTDPARIVRAGAISTRELREVVAIAEPSGARIP